MYISDRCAECLYDKQKARLDEEDYLREVRKLLNERRETDTAPYMVHQFNLLYEERCGKRDSYAGVKRMYNDLVLSMEKDVKAGIREASDPLARALAYARVGNYIDFGAMNHVDKDTFLALFQEADRAVDPAFEGALFKYECAVEPLIDPFGLAHGRFHLFHGFRVPFSDRNAGIVVIGAQEDADHVRLYAGGGFLKHPDLGFHVLHFPAADGGDVGGDAQPVREPVVIMPVHDVGGDAVADGIPDEQDLLSGPGMPDQAGFRRRCRRLDDGRPEPVLCPDGQDAERQECENRYSFHRQQLQIYVNFPCFT